MKKGTCYGVSVGPGDNNLITLEALSIIEQSDVIFLPSYPKEECKAYQIAIAAIPDVINKEICAETCIKSKDASVKDDRHQEIFQNVCKYLDSGKQVAFLTLGEATLYSTYIYIHQKLIDSGYESVFISGISSVQAISAKLNRPLAIKDDELHVFPNADKLMHKLTYSGTKVFMKTRKDLEEVIANIQNYARKNQDVDAYGISNCGMDNEIIANNVNELNSLSGYFTVIFVRENTDEFAPCSSFYENKACEYYPCHSGIEHMNCMFCFCPMYRFEKCLGRPTYKMIGDRNLKICSDCTFPHEKDHYKAIMDFLKNQ